MKSFLVRPRRGRIQIRGVIRGQTNSYPVGLASLQSESGIQWTLMMSASTFSLIALIILFFFVQKHLIESFARTGLKG